ncbi:MAG: GGDEF domain-containing protein [Lachnospiraceae bacterium]|nr:GGDEF domain-containing protein [Lachnospiraceae bacterium]MDD3660870.1 GGDEF domain-containing protein [Lachnospiraceae bacterium]
MIKTKCMSIRKVAALAFVFYLILYYSLLGHYMQSDPDMSVLLSNLFSHAGNLISVILIFVALQAMDKLKRSAWVIFLLGATFNMIGDLVWSIYELIFHIEVPTPSLCDVFYLSASVCYLVALILYIRNEQTTNVILTGFDILITMVVSTTVIFKYVMLPIWADSSTILMEKLVSLAYPIFDLGYLGGLFSLFFLCTFSPRINRTNLLIGISFIFWFIADMIFAIRESSIYVSEGFIDPLWPAGCLVLAIAALNYNEIEIEPVENRNQQERNIVREHIQYLFPYISVSFIIIMISLQYVKKDPLITGTAITVLLIIGRQIFSLMENKRLIRELKVLNSKNEEQANTDFLTGIFNRRYIDSLLESFVKKEDQTEMMKISMMLIDVDYYKQINDELGHHAGDRVLQGISELIKSSIRTMDTVGRFGGDEFIIILPDTERESAEMVAKRIIGIIDRQEFMVKDKMIKVTLSIGCVCWSGEKSSFNPEYVVAAADKALYQAKEGGRDQYVITEAGNYIR